jgi:hypothetical protein
MMQDEAEGEDRLRAANGRLMAEIERLEAERDSARAEVRRRIDMQLDNERLRAALREIAAVEPQSWTTRRARAALEQKAPNLQEKLAGSTEQQAPADAKEKDGGDWDHRTAGKASFFNPRN